jgi:mono/diheme cytochrome c family protein
MSSSVPRRRGKMRRVATGVLGALELFSAYGCQREPADSTQGDSNAKSARQGEREFAMRCASCHARGRAANGPSLEEIASLHRADPEGIVRWARTPGRKREQFPPMPSFRHLSEEDLRAIAAHMVKAGGEP